MKDDTLKFKDSIYVRINTLPIPSEESLGKTIGIAVYGEMSK
jgi:hypothetical protein